MKKCAICGKELTRKTVFGGFMGLMYRIIFILALNKDWKKFVTCQKCRDLFATRYSVEQIRRLNHELPAKKIY